DREASHAADEVPPCCDDAAHTAASVCSRARGRRLPTMRAAVLRAPRAFEVSGVARPSPGPGDVLVRVTLAGLCGTDYRIWTGERRVRSPLVPGHELIGVVESVGGDVASIRPGTRVAVEPNYSCGTCPLCREGNRNLCLSRTAVGIDVDGGFAELVSVP